MASKTCILCHHHLTDPVSIRIGYGPICAEKAGVIGYSSHLEPRRRKIIRISAWRRVRMLIGEAWRRDRLLFPELEKSIIWQAMHDAQVS